jgi:histidinol-phosphate aminotransferase
MSYVPIEHGGPDLHELQRLGIDPNSLVDFSVCTNPFGPSPRVREALAQVALDRYPDRECHALRQALAERFTITPQRIVVGNGVSELIGLAALAFIQPNDKVLILGPTYGEYQRSAIMHGGLVHIRNDFAPEGAIEAELRRGCPRVVFLCNPNNPTGALLPPDRIVTWTQRHPRTLFIVDEAYQAFAPPLRSLMAEEKANLLVLRSMTKDHALAALRIGYAVGAADVTQVLTEMRPPWSVNALAQAAAIAALSDEAHLQQSLKQLGRATSALVAGLKAVGLKVWPSQTHFFLVQVGDAAAFRLALLRRGILVRDATSFGLPEFVRLATRMPAENARLLAVLHKGW